MADSPDRLESSTPGQLTCAWPRPRLAINTPDTLELGMAEVAAGLKSHLMLMQDWYGIGRDEALELADQIRRDNEELAKVHPELAAAMMQRAFPPGPEGDEEAGDPAASGDDDGSGYR